MKGTEVARLARGSRSYRQMSNECRVSKSELHAIEHANVSPRIVTAQKICEIAQNGITLEDFMNADYTEE